VKQDLEPIVVHILAKEYRIACTENEKEALIASARLVDNKMREIRDSGKVIGTDRIAVMAALNIAHELLKQEQILDLSSRDFSRRVRQLQERLDVAMSSGNPVEL